MPGLACSARRSPWQPLAFQPPPGRGMSFLFPIFQVNLWAILVRVSCPAQQHDARPGRLGTSVGLRNGAISALNELAGRGLQLPASVVPSPTGVKLAESIRESCFALRAPPDDLPSPREPLASSWLPAAFTPVSALTSEPFPWTECPGRR